MVRDRDWVALLQWALPRIGLCWEGFRKVQRQVCRRIGRRMAELGLDGPDAYRRLLEASPAELERMDSFCRVTISRFHRDRAVFDRLRARVLPELAGLALLRGGGALRCWSAGCASGEEPYTVAILFRLAVAPRFPGVGLRVLGTDVDPAVLARARRGCYAPATLRELPEAWRQQAFALREGELCLREPFREGVAFRRQDLRARMPAGPFDLVLCRNLAFTYFDLPLQRRVLAGLRRRLAPGGFLVIGSHESLPDGGAGLVRPDPLPVFRRDAGPLEAGPVARAPGLTYSGAHRGGRACPRRTSSPRRWSA
jgi:chemotaxis protein methyltransferase CheR